MVKRAKQWRELPTVVKVYRGYSATIGNEEGLSWSLSPAVAKRFTARHGAAGRVAVGYVKRQDVLFYTNSRREKEIIALPSAVTRDFKEVISH